MENAFVHPYKEKLIPPLNEFKFSSSQQCDGIPHKPE